MELKATRYAVEDAIATVTLHRPERMNAWTGRMHTEYRWLMDQADNDPAVGAIIVTGEGRAFCAGADAKALEGHVAKGGYDPGTPADLAEIARYGARSFLIGESLMRQEDVTSATRAILANPLTAPGGA